MNHEMTPREIRGRVEELLKKAERATNWDGQTAWTYTASVWVELLKAVTQ